MSTYIDGSEVSNTWNPVVKSYPVNQLYVGLSQFGSLDSYLASLEFKLSASTDQEIADGMEASLNWWKAEEGCEWID